jgi:hypothetical protein
LHENDDHIKSDDKENDATDKWKEKLIKYKDALTSFNTCLKGAEWNEVPIHQNLLLHYLSVQTCKKGTDGTKQKNTDDYIKIFYKSLVVYIQRVFLTLLTGSRFCISRQPVHCKAHTNFADESARRMADKIRNEGK